MEPTAEGVTGESVSQLPFLRPGFFETGLGSELFPPTLARTATKTNGWEGEVLDEMSGYTNTDPTRRKTPSDVSTA